MERILLLCAAAVALAGCGGGAKGTASVLNGPTPATSRPAAPTATRPANGQWNLSPDKMKLRLKSVSLHTEGSSGPGSTADFENCVIEYDRSKVGLAKLADCPFEIDPGT